MNIVMSHVHGSVQVEDNLRLVAKIAHRYTGSNDFGDLFQSGCLGLIEASRRFDADRGYRFSTYAAHWITKYVHLERHRFRSVLTIPRRMQDDIPCVTTLNEDDCYYEDTPYSDDDADINEHVNRLPPLYRDVIRLRYGLGENEDAMTYRMIGKQLGISQTDAKQIEGEAIKMLRGMYEQD
jgi:RNA polymerase sigma factor (sigma-70 family)